MYPLIVGWLDKQDSTQVWPAGLLIDPDEIM